MIMMTMMASIDNENNDKYNDDNSDYESNLLDGIENKTD